MRNKQFRDVVLFVQHARHYRLRNPHQSAICHRDRRCYPQRLTSEAPLAEETAATQNGDNRFLALFGCDRELYLASPEVEHGIRRLSLQEDGAVHTVFQNGFPARDSSEEGFPINRAALIICRNNGLLLIDRQTLPTSHHHLIFYNHISHNSLLLLAEGKS